MTHFKVELTGLGHGVGGEMGQKREERKVDIELRASSDQSPATKPQSQVGLGSKS